MNNKRVLILMVILLITIVAVLQVISTVKEYTFQNCVEEAQQSLAQFDELRAISANRLVFSNSLALRNIREILICHSNNSTQKCALNDDLTGTNSLESESEKYWDDAYEQKHNAENLLEECNPNNYKLVFLIITIIGLILIALKDTVERFI